MKILMGKNVVLSDAFTGPAGAMFQALYSRTQGSVLDRMGEFEDNKEKFEASMKKYYLGYGHASIAELAHTTLFIEGVSLLCAKAFQNSPLYAGVETSTRYIDFSKQPFVIPNNEPEIADVMGRMRDFYLELTDKLTKYYLTEIEKPEDVSETVYNNTIKAKVFDICRGFLPAGVTTQFSWYTNLRHAREHLQYLLGHPLKEVRNQAEECWRLLHTKYPTNFPEQPTIHDINYEWWSHYGLMVRLQDGVKQEEIETPEKLKEYLKEPRVTCTGVDKVLPAPLSEKVKKGTPIPHYMKMLGEVDINFMLDYGSFRDIQRHRNGLCLQQVFHLQFGMHKWYTDHLKLVGMEEAWINIQSRMDTVYNRNVDREGFDEAEMQYMIPLGYLIPVYLKYSIPELKYVLELRTQQTVHPTLREVMRKVYHQLPQYLKDLIFIDDTETTLTFKRGQQTITKQGE